MVIAETVNTVLPRPRTRQLVCVMLLTYLALFLQPCAMAMGSSPDQHPDHCHQDAAQTDTVACMSQPALDCATDDLINDGRDPWKSLSDAPFSILVADHLIYLPADLVSRSAYFGRAPPPGAPPLNIRLCVYLK
jgi:hypothetical protein